LPWENDTKHQKNKLYIVGIGPGGKDQLTQKAAEVIQSVDHVVGYKAYLDLIRDLLGEKEVAPSGMGKEVDRAKMAVDFLEDGSVALVSSGDPNVYGMAGLGLEVASQKGNLNQVEVVPGATSFTAAACRAGITFRESVAVISLSDLLTPWAEIERRLEMAAEMSMPLTLYNPRSKKRTWQLERALEILSRFGRSHERLLLARNVSRKDEQTCWATVSELREAEELRQKVDMFTLLVVGGRGMTIGKTSSESKINLVGVGPGHPGHLTLEACRLLKESDHVLGAERYLQVAREIASGELVDHQGDHEQRMEARLAAAKAASRRGEKTSILVGGDPSIFSSAWRILGIEKAHVAPGVSAFSAIAARLGAPLVNDFVLVSGLQSEFEERKGQDLERDHPTSESRATCHGGHQVLRLMEAGFGVVIYNLDSSRLTSLAEQVGDLDRPCALAQDLTRPEEMVVVGRTSELASLKFSGKRCTLVLASPSSYIKEGRIITQRGYQVKYEY
jgi:precorrin-3B C17-methyltransferase